MTESTQRRVFALLAIAIAGGALLWMSMSTMDEGLVYYLSPTELQAKGDDAVGATVRVMGMVEEGSVDWQPETQKLAFRIRDGATSLPIEGQGAPPQMFRPGIGVVVEGRLHADGVFRSNTVIVKHDNEYRPPAEGEMPDEVYKALQSESS